MKNHIIIESNKELHEFVSLINERPDAIIGLDFEGDFNLYRYGIHLCLIQVSFLNAIYIIDPLKFKDLLLLKPVLESPTITKIIYSSQIDVRLLKHTHDIHLKNIFDIRIAGMLLEFENTSMPGIIETVLNIKTEKDHKNQKSNWSNRPLSKEQLEYAANDVRYLVQLHEPLVEMLKEKKKFKNFNQSCKNLEKLVFVEKKEPYKRMYKFGSLTKKEKILLKHFFYAREKIAKNLDYPPYWIMNKDDLLYLTKNPPSTTEEWQSSSRIAPRARKMCSSFVEAQKNAELEYAELSHNKKTK